jgi:multidrug efflux system membrane fusion protein
VDGRLEFLGEFSALQQLELRAQVGGTLTQIGFKDGNIVHKGDPLFVIDPTPYQITLSEALAQLESAHARLDLANRELPRATRLYVQDPKTQGDHLRRKRNESGLHQRARDDQ